MKASEMLDEILLIIREVKDDKKELQKILDFLQEEVTLPDEEDFEVKLPEKYNAVVKEIAEDIDAGLVCYLNPDTLEVDAFHRDLLANSYLNGMDTEVSMEDLKPKYTHWEKYFTIEPLETNESFKIMAKFTDQLDNSKLRTQLVYALNNRKPFANFKRIIDNSEFRQDWFHFKDKQLQEYVKTMIDLEIQGELT